MNEGGRSTRARLYTIVIIKKDGNDGPTLDLETGEVLFGSNQKCQIRLKPEYVTGVADQHARIAVESAGKATITNLSGQDNSVRLRSGPSEIFVTTSPLPLKHCDVITICTRSFRFEDISRKDMSKGHHDHPPAASFTSKKLSSDPKDSRSQESKRFREIRDMGIEKDTDTQMKDWGVYGPRRAKRASSPTSDGSKRSKTNGAPRRPSDPAHLGKWANAAKRVLEREGRPLTVREIADKALEYGFVTECGKTPQNSITSTLHSEIKKPNPLFKKVSAATFALTDASDLAK